jgi:hypothetical protein
MPVGRRRKQKKKKFNLPVLPVIENVKFDRIENLSQKIVQDDQTREGLETEKTGQEAAKIKAIEEARLLELESIAQETEVKRKREEEAHKLEEEKAAQEMVKIKALEEARTRELEEAIRIKALEEAKLRELESIAQETEVKRKREEEAHKLEEEKAAQEMVKTKALEKAKLRELERLAQEEEENKRREEENAVEEAGLKAERERWAKLAEEERKAKQKVSKQDVNREEAVLPDQLVTPEILPQDRACSGAIMLKALDCLIGGSKEINALISRVIGGSPEDSLNLTEALIFKSILGKDNFSTLGDLIGVRYPQEKLNSYYEQIKQVADIGTDVSKIIYNLFTEAKGVKLHFIDGSIIHLDARLYSVWPGTRFPYDFSNTVVGLKNNLNKYFISGAPLVLFSPFGYDVFPKDFFSFLLNLGSNNNPDSLTLFGNQLEELESVSLNPATSCSLVFGLWPWQFTSSRKVKQIGDFYLKYIKEIDRDLYLGEIEIDLFRPSLNQSITLKGCAVKTDLKEKICLVILKTHQQAMGLDELAGIYLSRWPNFEDSFQDFSRKIEIFTYASNEQKIFPRDSFGLDPAGLTKELADIFANYVKILDAYLRWYFLPVEYAGKDFSATNDCFYKLPVKLITDQNKTRVSTLVTQDYQCLKDLKYLNCRLNERQINSAPGKLFWFESAFK